jgi:hypothetical protein
MSAAERNAPASPCLIWRRMVLGGLQHRQFQDDAHFDISAVWCNVASCARSAAICRSVYSQPSRLMKFFAAALGHLVVILAVATEPSAATTQSNDSQLAVFARPLGVWCDGIARFTVGLSNPGPDRLVVGVPRRPDTRFPYKSTGTLSFNEKAGTGWGGACGCSAGVDCELCATPDIRVTLGAGEELTWTMEIANMELSVGPASLRLTLHWYGGPFRVGGALQKMSGSTGQELSVAGVDERCFVASAVAKKAG